MGCFIDANIHFLEYSCYKICICDIWRVWELIHIFLRPAKIPLDPLVTRSLIHAVYTRLHLCTHTNTHKPFIALNCASVWSVSVRMAHIRHHSSCILTTIQSNSGLRDWAGTLLHGDGCYHGNSGGVRPTNKLKNAVLSCFSPWENINFVLVYLSLPISFFLVSPCVEECMYLSLSLTILGLVGNCDVPQVCVSTRFLPSAVSLENLQTSFPKNGCKHWCSIIFTWSGAMWWLLFNYLPKCIL